MAETLFILGREPELSAAELEAVAPRWSAKVIVLSPEAALVKHEPPLPDRAIDRLGGSVKQVDVIDRWPTVNDPVDAIRQTCTAVWLERHFPEGRIEFGVSVYGTARLRAAAQRHFLDIKKQLHVTGRAARLVVSKEPQLSAVTVQRNGLLKHGKEFVFLVGGKELIVGTTTAVQDYRAYGLRDYGRPAANAKAGMLPPKLAQMMLNIAQVRPDDLLLDPFCGRGTILQEAALLGVRTIHGSDADQRAVKDSQENLRWLFKEFPKLRASVEILLRDAREISVKPSVIVTEPYLGQPLRGHEPLTWLQHQARDLEKLYLQCFQHWRKHLRPGSRVVMIWPEYVSGRTTVKLNLGKAVAGLGFQCTPLVSQAAAQVLRIADPTVLVYGRDDARVRRQVKLWVRQ